MPICTICTVQKLKIFNVMRLWTMLDDIKLKKTKQRQRENIKLF